MCGERRKERHSRRTVWEKRQWFFCFLHDCRKYFHKVIEPLSLEKTFKIKFNHQPKLLNSITKPCPLSVLSCPRKSTCGVTSDFIFCVTILPRYRMLSSQCTAHHLDGHFLPLISFILCKLTCTCFITSSLALIFMTDIKLWAHSMSLLKDTNFLSAIYEKKCLLFL